MRRSISVKFRIEMPTSESLVHQRNIEVVALGGGTGLATLLSGLKNYVGPDNSGDIVIRRLSAIVTVSDDGGSSGRLRDELQMPPPGDIRNCMVALSEDSHLLSRLFRYRFRGSGDLGGHSFGNLFLAAMSEITGDFAEAVRLSSEVLASKGHIYPATVSNVRIGAELTDGKIVSGETNVSKVGARIMRLYLEPEDCEPHPDALAAIEQADIITIGPGSLFTSLLPPLLVRGVPDTISQSSATKVFICNLMTQPGETDGFTARKHLEIVRKYAPSLHFDYVIVNGSPITRRQVELYNEEGAEQIGVHGLIESKRIEGAGVIRADLLAEGEKVRHDPERLARVVLARADARQAEK